jgi:hypothetical protein
MRKMTIAAYAARHQLTSAFAAIETQRQLPDVGV